MHNHSHSPSSTGEKITNSERQRATQTVSVVGAVINVLLSIVQLVGGLWANSHALIADSIHTLSDLVSDIVVIFAAQHAHKDADDNHPYGHGRIETVATVVLGLMLAGISVGIFMQAWGRLSGDTPVGPVETYALGLALVAIIAKEGLYHYTMQVARRLNSKLLQASAWHHRSDAISSVIVFIAIGGVLLGYPWMDAIAAIAVAVMILYMAGRMILDSMHELVDTGIEPERAEEMTHLMRSLEGVESVHMLRTRKMGGNVFADAHIQVANTISVSEGHQIAEQVMRTLKKTFPEVTDVTVHIDPEDDETARPSATLPLRTALLKTLQDDPRSTPVWEHIEKTLLHYIDGEIHLEVYLRTTPPPALLADFKEVCDTAACMGSVVFYQQVAQAQCIH